MTTRTRRDGPAGPRRIMWTLAVLSLSLVLSERLDAQPAPGDADADAALLAPPAQSRPTEPQKAVLILSTFEPYVASASSQEQGVRKTLARELPYLSVRSDYLLRVAESYRAPTPSERVELANRLRQQYDGQKPDLLVLIDTIAVDLIATEARDVFEGVPVVYTGLVGTPDRAAGLNATGVVERIDAQGTVELIRRLQPDVREVLFTARESQVLEPLADFARKELASTGPTSGLTVRWTQAKTIAELEAEAATLPDGARAAIVMMTFEDPSVPIGELFARLGSLPRPVYATYASQLAIAGVIGGRVIDAEAQGRAAGKLCVRVLRGEEPSSIPPLLGAGWVTAANHSRIHDWRLDHSRLPEGTLRLGWPSPWMGRYAPLLFWGTAAAVLQVGIIGLLLLQRSKARRAESALQAERDRLQFALEGSTHGAWDWDVESDVTHWSSEFGRLLGLGESTGLGHGQKLEQRVHPDDLAAMRAALQAHVAGRAEYDVEFRLLTPDRGYRWFRSRGRAVRGARGRAARVAGTITDVHEVVVARSALGESEQRFRAAFERHLLPMFVYDRGTGLIMLVNDAMTRTYGHPRERAEGLPIMNLLHPDERERMEELLRSSDPSSEHQGSWRHVTADGRTMEVLISSIPLPWAGRPLARLVTSIDLTERTQTQRALAERERFIQQITSAVPVVIYVYDLVNRRNTYVNRRIEDSLGYSPEQIRDMGEGVLRGLMEPEDWQRYLNDYLPRINAAKDYEVVEFEYRLRHADGSCRWLMGRDMVMSRGPDGAPTSMIGSAIDMTEQRLAAERLARSEDRLAMALRASGVGVFDWDVPTGRITWSPEHAAIWGMRLEDFDGSYALFVARVHPEDLSSLNARLQAAIAGRTDFRHEYRLRMPDGSIKWILGRGEFVFDESGSPVRMVGLVTDITGRRAAEQALRVSEATNRALLSAVPDLMFRMDRGGRYLDYHAPDPSTLLVPPEKFLGRHMDEVLPDFLLGPTRENLARLFETRVPQSFEYEAPPSRGRPISAWEVRMVRIDADTALVVVRDITARREAEQRLRENQQRLSMLIGATPLGVMFIDTSFRIQEWNPGAERIFGFAAAEIIGRRADVIIPDSERRYVERINRELLANTGGFRGTNKNLRKDGREIYCEWYNSPLMDADGKVLGVACVVEDVTESTLAARRQSRMLAELDHRVKNNLASIISLAELTGRGAESVPDFLGRFRVRLDALARMHTILAHSRWEGTDLRALLEDTLEAYGASSRSTIGGPGVNLSPRTAQSLAMALNELATNAAKYGSLSAVAGRLDVAWTVTTPDSGDPTLELLWTESGGPTISPPTRKGFGSELIQGTIGFELGGTVCTDFRPEGLACQLVFPLRPDSDNSGESVMGAPLHLEGSEDER